MTMWTPQRLVRLRQQLARIAATPGTLHDRASAVLQVLEDVLPTDAALVALHDPEQRRHIPLATSGRAEPLRRKFAGQDVDDEIGRLGLGRRRPAVLASELPGSLIERRGWAEHLLPAGFRGGLAAELFTPGGRHIGFLSLLTEAPDRPRSADRDAIAAVAPVIAHALDRTREIADTARIIEGARAGVVLTRSGGTERLPGLVAHRLLAPRSPLLVTAAAELAESDTYVSFLAPVRPAGEADDLGRVTVLDCTRSDLDHLCAAVLLSAPGDLHGLSSLQLRLLGLLAQGTERVPQLAAALGVDPRTATDILRATLSALQTDDLTAATVHAVRTGLRIPPRLAAPT